MNKMYRFAVSAGLATLGVVGWSAIVGLLGHDSVAEPTQGGQGGVGPPVSTLDSPTPRLAAVAVQHSAAAAESVSNKYIRVLEGGGLEANLAGFHLAEPQVLAAQPPYVPWKESPDGRCYMFLDKDLDAFIAGGGTGVIPTGNASFHGGENPPPQITLKSSVSIRRVIPSGSYTAELSSHGNDEFGIFIQLTQSSRDLVDGLVGTPVMSADGFDWAHTWKLAGDLVTPFDLVLVLDGQSIGFLSGLDMITDGTYSGELLDKETAQPLSVELAEAQGWLDRL